KGKRLTSEMVKEVINVKLMEAGSIAAHTIVSCGTQCVDPHHQGSGPLLACESIIMDVFPRSSRSRYFADMSRTAVRGKASEKLKRMYRAVKEGQDIAFRQIRDGADGMKIHEAIVKYFETCGFRTGEIGGRMQGFFHGTGQGVGLDIHEPPRISRGRDILRAGQVVTVEPGLYYLDAGGVRIEDMVLVTKTGYKNLTRFPKVLEI
ncbi:MAG: aminopeptidase P family protein, partial [Parcubacteria group bacterium]|nr:aminopeptidase P family protein [Parcubacteria group bacterium]